MAPRAYAVVAVLAFGGIVVSLMQTLVIPIVPELPRLLNAPASDTAWAVTATLLAAAVATPVTGRLGDMYGKRRLMSKRLVSRPLSGRMSRDRLRWPGSSCGGVFWAPSGYRSPGPR